MDGDIVSVMVTSKYSPMDGTAGGSRDLRLARSRETMLGRGVDWSRSDGLDVSAESRPFVEAPLSAFSVGDNLKKQSLSPKC